LRRGGVVAADIRVQQVRKVDGGALVLHVIQLAPASGAAAMIWGSRAGGEIGLVYFEMGERNPERMGGGRKYYKGSDITRTNGG